MDSERSGDGQIALTDLPLSEVRRRQRQTMARLRDTEHWRRLVAARLDLAIAAVTDIDDLAEIPDPVGGGPLPHRTEPAPTKIGSEPAVARGATATLDVTDHGEPGSDCPVADRPAGPLCRRLPLRDLLGIPRSEGRLPESALLLQLRDALRELDHYAGSLRSDVAATARLLAGRMTEEDQDTFGHETIAGS